MRCQAAIGIAISMTGCGRGADQDPGNAPPHDPSCAHLVIELADEHAPLMKALVEAVDKDKAAPRLGVYAQTDEWKDATGAAHVDYRLAGSDRAKIEAYLAARAKQDAKLAPAADRAFRFEKTVASGRTYWRTHYVIARPPVVDSAVAKAEAASDAHGAHVTVRLAAADATKLVAAAAAHIGTKLTLRVGDTVISAPIIGTGIDGSDRVVLAMAEETPELDAQVAALTAKQLSCAP